MLNLKDDLSGGASVGITSFNGRNSVLTVQTGNSTGLSLGDRPISPISGGNFVRLKDIANIRDSAPEPTCIYRINGITSVTVVVDMDQAVNMLTVADRVFQRANEIAQALPDNCSLIKQSDQSWQLRTEFHRLFREVYISIACLWVILVLFLGNTRAPLLLLASILFSVAGTFVVFQLLHVGLNLLTMGGLVLGFGQLVDDSIVVLDSIQRRIGVGDRRTAVVAAVRHVALPVVASTATKVGALIPIAFLPLDLRLIFGALQWRSHHHFYYHLSFLSL